MAVVFRDVSNAELVRQSLRDVLPNLVALYASAAASLAADWYDELRADAAAAGRFQPIIAPLPDVGRTNALAGWAVGPLFGATPNAAAAQSMAAGGLQRIIFDADRNTISQSSVLDRASRGWQREGSGECAFCSMLIDRGAVYSESTADFLSHDKCQCIAVAAF